MEYVAYLRVSTEDQGAAGLGITAQKKAVEDFAAAEGSVILKTFEEVESGSDSERPKMKDAMVYAQLRGAVLLVKTLDRISRDLHFITALEKSEVAFKIVDMPNADSFTLHIYGSLAERERQLISIRTKAALAGKVGLGTPENLTDEARALGRAASIAARRASADKFAEVIGPMIAARRAEGMGWAAVADWLNKEGFKTKRGSAFQAATVQRIMDGGEQTRKAALARKALRGRALTKV